MNFCLYLCALNITIFVYNKTIFIMANEREVSTAPRNKGYYQIDGEGRLFRKATSQELESGANIVTHTKTKGKNIGQTELRTIIASGGGYVTSVRVESSDYSDNLIVEMFENNFTSCISVILESNFADDLIRKCVAWAWRVKLRYSSRVSRWIVTTRKCSSGSSKGICAIRMTSSISPWLNRQYALLSGT